MSKQSPKTKNSLDKEKTCDCCGEIQNYKLKIAPDNSKVCNNCAKYECCILCRNFCGDRLCGSCRFEL